MMEHLKLYEDFVIKNINIFDNTQKEETRRSQNSLMTWDEMCKKIKEWEKNNSKIDNGKRTYFNI